MAGYGSTAHYATTLTDLPAEVIGQICESLTLEQIANLQESDPYLDTVIDFIFFPKLKKMRVSMDERGAMITLSARATHSYLHECCFSIAGDSAQRQRVIKSCTAVDSLTISCSDHHRDHSVLDAINRADITLVKLVVNIHRPAELKEVCRKTVNRSHRKITTFVSEQAESLLTLKLSTAPEDTIAVELRPADSAIAVSYAHGSDSALHQSLIYPLFNALNLAKTGPTSVLLTVDWRDRLDLALQSAFMVALPIRHRSGVRTMRIGFSTKVASLTHAEMHACLEAFSSQLSDTHRLQELLCDLSRSKVDPSQLERTISVLSSQLGVVHRIRVLTDGPPAADDEGMKIKREWAALPPVY